MCQFVQNFLSYVSAKYHLNWFTVGKVITVIKRVNFLLRHSVQVESFFYKKNYILQVFNLHLFILCLIIFTEN